jgi:CheY-like chemotaxis protein
VVSTCVNGKAYEKITRNRTPGLRNVSAGIFFDAVRGVTRREGSEMTGNGLADKTRVLLVDDDPEVAWVVGKYLTKAGYAITTCADGAEAINLLDSLEFFCVVTDIKMPNVNGVALVEWLRRNRPGTRVVVMTAFGSPFVRELVLGKGAMVYLEKPVDPQLLVDVISRKHEKTAFSGTISDIDIMDYLQLMVLAGKKAVIEIISRAGTIGQVFVSDGRIIHSTCEEVQGEEALYRCLTFEGGSFSNLPWKAPDRQTINKPSEFLLIEASRQRDELKETPRPV